MNWVALSVVFNFKADKQYYLTFITDCRLQVVWESSYQFSCDLETVVCTHFFLAIIKWRLVPDRIFI